MDISKETPAQVQGQIDDLNAKIADPSVKPAHKAFFVQLLHLLLKWLPVVIEIFHHTTNTTGGTISSPASPASDTAVADGVVPNGGPVGGAVGDSADLAEDAKPAV